MTCGLRMKSDIRLTQNNPEVISVYLSAVYKCRNTQCDCFVSFFLLFFQLYCCHLVHTRWHKIAGITKSANQRKVWVRQLSLFYFCDSLGDYLNCVVILNLTLLLQWPIHVQTLWNSLFVHMPQSFVVVVFLFIFSDKANSQLLLSRLEDLLFLGDPVKDIQGC